MPDRFLTHRTGRTGAGFTEIEHTADYALRIQGRDLRALLLNGARGLYSLIGPQGEPDDRAVQMQKRVEVAAPDTESLLVEWLSELAYWVEAARFVGTEFDFRAVSHRHLAAEIRGWQAERIDKLIKAVTYHDLKIRETPAGLVATVVFDV